MYIAKTFGKVQAYSTYAKAAKEISIFLSHKVNDQIYSNYMMVEDYIGAINYWNKAISKTFINNNKDFFVVDIAEARMDLPFRLY